MGGKSQAQSEELICVDDCMDSFLREMSQLITPSITSPKVATSNEGLLIMQSVDEIYTMMNKIATE
jgi:hypothetical protein